MQDGAAGTAAQWEGRAPTTTDPLSSLTRDYDHEGDGVDVVSASPSSLSTSTPSTPPTPTPPPTTALLPPTPAMSHDTLTNPTNAHATQPNERQPYPHSIIWHLPPSRSRSGSPSTSSSTHAAAHHALSHFLPIHTPFSDCHDPYAFPHFPSASDAHAHAREHAHALSRSYPMHDPHPQTDPAHPIHHALLDPPPLPSHPVLSSNAIDQLWPQLEALVEPYGLRRRGTTPTHDDGAGGSMAAAAASSASSGAEEAEGHIRPGQAGEAVTGKEIGEQVRKKADDLRDPEEDERKAARGE